MTTDANIHVHHLTRVEGHGDIIAEIADGQLREVQFNIVEAPRFFEGILRGQDYPDVVHIASRICGICAVSHKGAALKATEAVMNVEVSEQTNLLRRLAFHGEVLSSHLLHIYFLALPDFVGLPSVMPLINTQPDLVKQAMRLKQIGYDLAALIGGRHTHPVAMRVGGFSFTHAPADMLAMRERLVNVRADLEDGVELFATLDIPQLERETEYVSLTHPDRYAFYDGDICSSDGEVIPPTQYQEALREFTLPRSTAKHARWNRPEYMVGALARFNNNHTQLHPVAQDAAAVLDLRAPCYRPFMVTVAQLVECVHCVEDSIELIDALVERGISHEDEQAEVVAGAGRAAAAVEAPRGLLIHEYEYDDEGKCVYANHVIPTAQNLGNLEADMRKFVPQIVDRSEDRIRHGLEMLVRAYDPCISCSTHMVHVNFVD